MRDGQQELTLGQLALQKSKNEDVKRFAQIMVTDHSAANDKLKSLVQGQRSESPRNAAPGAGPAPPEERRLRSLEGAAFDKQYAAMMVADDHKAIAPFDREEKSGTGAIKGFAPDTLPTLKTHLEHAQDLQKKFR